MKPLTEEPPIGVDDAKRARVLEGAIKVFLAYGFQRTTMDDIARSAEISRPALYLLFRNKADIYRALALGMLDGSLDAARTALSGKGGFEERLSRAIEGGLFAMMEAFEASPHGAEMLDMKNSLASDIVAGWRERLSQAVAPAIADEAARNGVDLAARGLSASGLAATLLDGLEGMKARVSDRTEQRKAAAGLVRLVGLALQP